MHVSSQPPMHLDAHDAGPNCMNHVYLDIILLLTILLHFTYSLRLCVYIDYVSQLHLLQACEPHFVTAGRRQFDQMAEVAYQDQLQLP